MKKIRCIFSCNYGNEDGTECRIANNDNIECKGEEDKKRCPFWSKK